MIWSYYQRYFDDNWIVEMLNKVTSTMVTGDGAEGAGEQVNLNELDSQMEQIKDMFVKKQEMMKKMSTTTAPNPAELAA